MDDAGDLAGLRGFVTMLGDEHLLEGWAALAGQSGGPVLGLVLLTDQRVIFIDVQAGLTAFPISKISHVEVIGPCAVTFTVWYGTMALTFDGPGIRGTMLNLLRQDPGWTAREASLADHLIAPWALASRRSLSPTRRIAKPAAA